VKTVGCKWKVGFLKDGWDLLVFIYFLITLSLSHSCSPNGKHSLQTLMKPTF
jgi:hypothetical protein